MSRKPRKYTVKVDYPALQRAIDAHEVYRGNNTSFCIGMGFEKRTSWVSDIKRGRNFPSPEEAAKMCLLLKTTPEEILLHSGPTEEETQKCLEDIEEVKRLIEVERGRNAKKEAPAEVGGGKDALLDFIRKTDDRTTLLAVLDEVNKKLQEMR